MIIELPDTPLTLGVILTVAMLALLGSLHLLGKARAALAWLGAGLWRCLARRGSVSMADGMPADRTAPNAVEGPEPLRDRLLKQFWTTIPEAGADRGIWLWLLDRCGDHDLPPALMDLDPESSSAISRLTEVIRTEMPQDKSLMLLQAFSFADQMANSLHFSASETAGNDRAMWKFIASSLARRASDLYMEPGLCFGLAADDRSRELVFDAISRLDAYRQDIHEDRYGSPVPQRLQPAVRPPRQLDGLIETWWRTDPPVDNWMNEDAESGFRALFSGAGRYGKTWAACHMASRLKHPVVEVGPLQAHKRYFGEGLSAIAEQFDLARRCGGLILLDGVDAVVPNRDLIDVSHGSNNAHIETVDMILSEIDRFSGPVIATTRYPLRVDPGLRDRLVREIRFEKPAIVSLAQARRR